jgi:malate dehydrogenase (oxaloacetate-decarboxylating)
MVEYLSGEEGLLPLPRVRGMELLDTPLLNKGTAFTNDERTALNLHGLLPPQVESLREQAGRAYRAFQRKTDDLERHIFLRALQDTNEVLFYRLLLDHMEEMMPVVYTPVVALGCEEFSHIYRRPRGLFLPYPLRDKIPQLLQNRASPEVDVIVVTDGERILGIGDQGAGGLGIPIGKLSLYTLIGGIRPERTLPIALDVGTNNAQRLKDPEYLGWRHERVTGPEYFDFIQRFVDAVKEVLPHTCLQWEDFSAAHARPILERYRNQLLTFNDDVQGTAAVVLGVIQGASRVARIPFRNQVVAIFGAGSAGVGVADYLRSAMVEEGLPDEEARRRFWLMNSKGLLHSGRKDLNAEQQVYAQPFERVADWPRGPADTIGLAEVVHEVHPTILIGLSTLGGSFTQAVVRDMAAHTDRPIIMPLSNPTVRAEARPEDLISWTDGRALVATGSPFPPVYYGNRTYPIAQCNNVYIFPALGLGVIASRARRVTDGMILASARALGEHAPAAKDPAGSLLPPVRELRSVAVEIALVVGLTAQHDKVAPVTSPETLRERILETQWTPTYPRYTTE